MTADYYHQAFAGVHRLYPAEAAQRLACAQVAVIGLGGVGSWVAEALARSGVQRFVLIDLDDICISNTNRQAHTLHSTLGQYKVDIMAQRLVQINPNCQVQSVRDFLTPQTLTQYITPCLDLVVDAIDSLRAKAAMIAYCHQQGIALVTTAGAGGRIDPTQVRISDLACTHNDPLTRRLRSCLRREYGFTREPKQRFQVPCVFSTEPMQPSTLCAAPTQPLNGPLNCAGALGASMMVTASFAMAAAAKAVEIIVG